MKLLQIVSKVPYPLDDGAKIEVYNSISRLDKSWEVTLVAFYLNDRELEYKSALQEICKKVYFVKRYKNPILPLLNFIQSLPYTMMLYDSDVMRTLITKIAKEETFDLVRIDHPHMAQYADCIPRVPKILRLHNIESQILERFSAYQRNPVIRYYAKWQAGKLREYERKIIDKFNHVLVISPADLKLLQQIKPGVKASVITAGTTIPKPGDPFTPAKPKQLIYCGAMDWFPNLDAITYFSTDILPLIVKKVPEVDIVVAGKNPKPSLKKTLHNRIRILGWVEDVKPFLKESRATIIPLRYGGGIRLKILEALALGLPVVTTTIGCEGIEVTPGKNILIGDTPESFAEQTLRVLSDDSLRNQLIKEGKQLIQEKYEWQKIGKELDNLYNEIRRED